MGNVGLTVFEALLRPFPVSFAKAEFAIGELLWDS